MLETEPKSNPPRGLSATALLLAFLVAALFGSVLPTRIAATQQDEPVAKSIYKLGITAADVDTNLDAYMTQQGGISMQCERINEILRSECCPRFELGCDVRYECERLAIDDRDRMTNTAFLYNAEFSGSPGYASHHQSVLNDVIRFFRTLQLYGRLERKLPIAYTKYPIRIDDEETKIVDNKIDRRDPSFLLMGSILPGVSRRDGTRMRLDYYASKDGLLLSVPPTNPSSLALAIAEYRANLFSVDGKQFTGLGARDLFDLQDGEAVPRLSGCQALSIQEPPHLQPFLPAKPGGGR